MNLHSDIAELKGVGPKTEKLLKGKEICTAKDLLYRFPARYDFYPPVTLSSEAAEGEICALRLTILGNGSVIRAGGKIITHLRAGDAGGEVRLTYFNMPYIKGHLPGGTRRIFRGRIKTGPRGQRYMEQPQVVAEDAYAAVSGTLQPVYPLFQGVTNRQLCGWTRQVLDIPVREILPEAVRERYGLSEINEALQRIHFPQSAQNLARARDRLVFDEFFRFILAIRRQKDKNALLRADRPLTDNDLPDRLLASLPYSLTGAQMRAFEEIRKDLTGPFVMNRLLQGDVGSGKTILAFLAMLLCAGSGRQSALMAPTEVLARQHMESLTRLFESAGLPVRAVLLTGSVKGKERKEAYRMIAAGEADMIIGTHALIQEKVEYRDLGLVITDEQHRFGVRQRENLAGKGEKVPVLVMSATPIPRTLAIILYGDLEISVLDEMPAGRLPIKNLAMPVSERNRIYRFLYRQIREGRQVYVICPEVEEGMLEDLENVTDYTKRLREIFPEEVRIDSLHGRMKPAQKQAVMDAFGRHETDLLVSTTVIEVGIDVPNASAILIENAERFGMSQLHQLRGRVGRGKWQSYCIFLYSGAGEKPKRLDVLEHTNDGFKVAEEDLKLRGPGDLFGYRQSGELGFGLADIYADAAIMKKASEYADEVLRGEGGAPSDLKEIDFRSI